MTDLRNSGTDLQDRPIASQHPHAPASGAVAAGGEKRRRRAIWPWLLGLLALLALGALLLGLLGGDDDGDRAATSGQQTQQQDRAAGDPGSGTGPQNGGAAGSAAADSGTLVARGENILPPPAGGLGGYVGEQATGKAVVVQSVVRGAQDPNQLEGFFVGTSEQDRTYVEWGGEVGSNEADFKPEVGQKVDLEGPVRPAPQDPAKTLKLDEADARVVSEQGGYVNADQVRPAE